MSDGLVAMQYSLVPRMASVRLMPVMAEQPVPGSRLLQGIAVSRKYIHRVRCSRLPAVVAMFRIWAERLLAEPARGRHSLAAPSGDTPIPNFEPSHRSSARPLVLPRSC